MYKISNFSDNDDVKIIDKSGPLLIKFKLDKTYLNPEIDLSLAANQLEPLPSIMTLEPIAAI